MSLLNTLASETAVILYYNARTGLRIRSISEPNTSVTIVTQRRMNAALPIVCSAGPTASFVLSCLRPQA